MIPLRDKQGVTEVVVVVLTILIVLVSASAIFVYVRDFVSSPQLLSPSECLDVQSSNAVSLGRVCYNELNGDLEVVLKRGVANAAISSIKLSSDLGEGASSVWECANSCGTCNILTSGSTSTYYLSAESKPTSVTLYVNDCEVLRSKVLECS